MKSVSKKLLCLVMVAMLMVSAIPFQASAAPQSGEIELVVRVGDEEIYRESKKPSGTTAVVKNLLTYWFQKNWSAEYDFVQAYSNTNKAMVGLDDDISLDDTVAVRLVKKGGSSDPEEPAESPVVNPESPDEGKEEISSSGTSDKVSYNKWKVYMYIYTNNDLNNYKKKVDITDSFAVDGTVSFSELQTYVMNNFTSNNSLGITIDGFYVYEGSWASNWLDGNYKHIDYTIPDVAHRTSDINLMVMLTGVNNVGTVSTKSTTASSSNPKTGDSIMTAVVSLGLSASALAAVYFVEKKRIAL